MLELLQFYRNKLDNYEKERVEWMCEVEQMHSAVQVHQETEQEILKRKQEITELQKALSDSHVAIYEERNTVNALRLKYEDVLKTERADLRRIRELKELGKELTTQQKLAVNFKDCRPVSAQKAIPLDRREKGMKKQYALAFSDPVSANTTLKVRPLSSSGKKPKSEGRMGPKQP